MNQKRPLPNLSDWRRQVYHESPNLDLQTHRDWRCPVCDRSKFETVRWFDSPPARIAGFRLMLVRHHDHAVSETEIIDGRFPVTVICNDCNQIDGRVKVTFPELPRTGWSFSCDEMRRIIRPKSHNRPWIDYKLAKIIALRILFEQRPRSKKTVL